MQNLEVKLIGISPLLSDRPTIEELTRSTTRRKGNTLDISLEERLHKNGNGIYVPFEWVDRCIKNTSKQFKEPGKRGGSYYKSISGAYSIEPDEIMLIPQQWTTFTHIVKRKDGNRVVKSNPMFEKWSIEFRVLLADWFDKEIFKEILEQAGKMEGIGAWRPACGGRFGKFEVNWE